jgi:hypothetical protein
MLRPIFKSSSASAAATRTRRQSKGLATRSMATQSGDDTKKPVALAKLHLEDGTTLVGKSFGSHSSVEGEVRYL